MVLKRIEHDGKKEFSPDFISREDTVEYERLFARLANGSKLKGVNLRVTLNGNDNSIKFWRGGEESTYEHHFGGNDSVTLQDDENSNYWVEVKDANIYPH